MEKCYYGSLKNVKSLQKSSSGGLAFSISNYALNKQWIVYGVAYSADFRISEYVRITNEKDLYILNGSKYVFPGNLAQILPLLKRDLQNNEQVVFFALPCHAKAIEGYLKREYISFEKSLVMIDLVCGGAVDDSVHIEYVEELEKRYKSKIVAMSVRYKNPDWTPPYLFAQFENGKKFIHEFYKTEYGFLFETMKKESCYNCKCKGNNRFSDITIGDAWGLNQHDCGYNLYGISVAFVHTEAGDKLLSLIDDFNIYCGDFQRMLNANPRYLSTKTRSERFEAIKLNVQRYGVIKGTRKSMNLKEKVFLVMPASVLMIVKEILHFFGK